MNENHVYKVAVALRPVETGHTFAKLLFDMARKIDRDLGNVKVSNIEAVTKAGLIPEVMLRLHTPGQGYQLDGTDPRDEVILRQEQIIAEQALLIEQLEAQTKNQCQEIDRLEGGLRKANQVIDHLTRQVWDKDTDRLAYRDALLEMVKTYHEVTGRAYGLPWLEKPFKEPVARAKELLHGVI